MDKLRHVALFTDDPPATARFYQEVFDLQVAGPAGAEGVYLTDGYINLSHPELLSTYGQGPKDGLGFDHFGFKVDDLDATIKKLEAAGAP